MTIHCQKKQQMIIDFRKKKGSEGTHPASGAEAEQVIQQHSECVTVNTHPQLGEDGLTLFL